MIENFFLNIPKSYIVNIIFLISKGKLFHSKFICSPFYMICRTQKFQFIDYKTKLYFVLNVNL